MKKQIVIIWWDDACMHGSGSQHEKDCKKYELMKLVSAGVLVHETKTHITLGGDYCEEYKNYRNVSVFPKSGIKKIRRIKVKTN